MRKILAALALASLISGYACTDNPKQATNAGYLPNTPSSYLCDVRANTRPEKRKVEKPYRPSSPKASAPPRNHLQNSYNDGNLSVYFLTNSWALYDNDKNDIRSYLKSVPSGTNFVLEGYADFRGSIGDNLELSENRAKGVENFISANKRFRMAITAYGEKDAQPKGTNIRKLGIDRRVKIIPNETAISRGLAELKADYYLLDQSSSMDGSKWREVQNYTFPVTSGVFTFTTASRPCGTDIKDEQAMGSTPLYASLLELIEKSKPSKSITVLTDGEDTEGGSPGEIKMAANKKKTKISFIGIGLQRKNELHLADIALHTGGKIYLAK